MSEVTRVTVDLFDEGPEELIIKHAGEYQDGSTALALWDAAGPVGKLTVCVPGAVLQANEVLVKTWGENSPLREPLLATGVFRDYGRRIKTGYVEAEVWQIVYEA